MLDHVDVDVFGTQEYAHFRVHDAIVRIDVYDAPPGKASRGFGGEERRVARRHIVAMRYAPGIVAALVRGCAGRVAARRRRADQYGTNKAPDK